MRDEYETELSELTGNRDHDGVRIAVMYELEDCEEPVDSRNPDRVEPRWRNAGYQVAEAHYVLIATDEDAGLPETFDFEKTCEAARGSLSEAVLHEKLCRLAEENRDFYIPDCAY